MGNSEMFGRFVCGFLAARADRRDLELRKRAQGRNVGIAPPAVAHTCSNDANADFFCRHDVFSLSGLSTLRWTRSCFFFVAASDGWDSFAPDVGSVGPRGFT